MTTRDQSFGYLFKKFRLKSSISTLAEFADELAQEGLVFETSLFSHWQKGNRVPKNRKLLVKIIKIFIRKGGIVSIKEANMFLDSAGQGYLTEDEIQEITHSTEIPPKLNPPRKIVDFLLNATKSKRIRRSGWVRENIENPESVADHSFLLSVLAMVLGDQLGVDKEKLIKMAILHDFGEVVTGDIVWSRGENLDIRKRAEKEIKEKGAILQLFKIIGKADEYVKIFNEMIERSSQETKVFWQLDKLEMALQALIYEKEQKKNLDEFFINADLQIHSKLLRKILQEILKQRPKI